MKLPNKVYDILKYICLIVIPAAVVVVATCGKLWGLDDETIKIITGSLTGLATAVGATLGFSSAEYYKDKEEASESPQEPSETISLEPVATIYLSPSQQSGNLYAFGNTNEREQCEKIASACRDALELRGFKVYLTPERDVTLRVVDAVKAGDVDWYIPIHTNAFDGSVTGTRLMIREKTQPDLAMAEYIMKYLDAVCPGKSSNIKALGDKWYEQRLTEPIPSVYCECEFHDNKTAAEFIVGHTTEIGESIARGICEFYDVAW